MGFFYIGGKTNNSVNGYVKIGESNKKYLSSRVAQIRKKQGNFVIFKYLEIQNSTCAMTRAIEGHVRFVLENAGYVLVGNDHFAFPITPNNKKEKYQKFTEIALQAAYQYCEMMKIEYEIKDPNPKARKTCRKKKK